MRKALHSEDSGFIHKHQTMEIPAKIYIVAYYNIGIVKIFITLGQDNHILK